MKPARREPHIRAIDSPPEWASWPDDRIRCQECGNRSGFRCIPLSCSTHPLELRHRCEKFTRRNGQWPR